MKSLVVSIHDVSPLTREAADAMLRELRALGVEKTSLLVIANHHHRGHFLDDVDFCEWLRAQEKCGDEIVIHGYYHLRERKRGETLWQKGMTRIYTRDEGEFFDISEAEAAEKIALAQREFAQAGFAPRGFIAPAWLLSEAGERAARAANFEYTTRLATVSDFRTGEIHASQSMVYSVSSAWRRAASLAWNAQLYRRLRENPLLRIGLHPPDYAQPKIWRQILRYVALALKERAPTTYGEWISVSRSR